MKAVLLLLLLSCFVIVLCDRFGEINLDYNEEDEEIHPQKPYSKRVNSKSKIKTLGKVLKGHIQALKKTANEQIDLVFLLDSSTSVGANNFREEIKFVKKLLSGFTVDANHTRVSVVSFSSRRFAVRHVDYLADDHKDRHKCSLLEEDLKKITYSGGGSFIRRALLEAKNILKNARESANKAIFLVTGGFRIGGDPTPVAKKLRKKGIKIFTFGIKNANVRGLFTIASHPKNESTYILDSFEEFEALAKMALHEDLTSGKYIEQEPRKCRRLCVGRDCCDTVARCNCGTHTGKYECICPAGYFGNGLVGGCQECPSGTYKPDKIPGDVLTCTKCPDENHITVPGATSIQQCMCRKGYRNIENKGCAEETCPALMTPKNGNMICTTHDFSFNTVCRFTCDMGYKLVGSRKRTCLTSVSAFWTGINTKCREETCPALMIPKNGNMICTTHDFSFNTVCRFTCDMGYKLVGSRKRTCLTSVSAFWTGINTKCRDIEAPVIMCPYDIVTETDLNESTATVSWQVPLAVDNSGYIPILSSRPAVMPPEKFPIGTTKVTYLAEDHNKNKADCHFYVTVKGLGGQQELIETDHCLGEKCQNGGTCVPMKPFGFYCICAEGFKGDFCQSEVDECDGNPCQNDGTCHDLVADYICICKRGFTGKNCESNNNDCIVSPCANGGTCIDETDRFVCNCADGFEGPMCEVNINECESAPCLNGGTCHDMVAGYECKCPDGIRGERCEIDDDDCASEPCQNGGLCTDTSGSFNCHCKDGFTGEVCDVNIDECASNPCKFEAKCEDLVAGYKCHCPSGKTGEDCSTVIDTNFQLDFPATVSIMDYARVDIDEDITAATVCFWMKTDDTQNQGTPFSYANEDGDNMFTLTDYDGFVFYVFGKEVTTTAKANDGKWHHVCVLWESDQGLWKLYTDGFVQDSGRRLSRGKTIKGGGHFIIGQEQDDLGGGFSSPESFIGQISQLNMWGRFFTRDDIEALRQNCSVKAGDIIAWADVTGKSSGAVSVTPLEFCKNKTNKRGRRKCIPISRDCWTLWV